MSDRPIDTSRRAIDACLNHGSPGWHNRLLRAVVDERDAARAEIERLGRELNIAKYGEPDFSWSIHKEAMSELQTRAEKAEAERDSQEADFAKSIAIEVAARLKAEAERDEARAQVAAAYEAAAKTCSLAATNYLGKGADTDLGSRSRAICDAAFRIRALIPAHAQSALEAYGREKVREGMQRAAEIIRGFCPECLGTGVRDSGGVHPWGEPISVPCDCTDAILGGMEKEGGE